MEPPRLNRVRLVVPHDVDRLTGGNVYDLRMAAELEQLGVWVDLVRAGDADLGAAAPGPGCVLIDGLLASHRPEVVRACRAGVLLHMPLAWRAPPLADLEREALRAASLVIATSEWTAAFLLNEYAVQAAVVTPGVDPAPIEPGSDPPLIVQVGAFAPHKNQLAVVRALAAVAGLPWRARLVGSHDADPVYAAKVVALVDDLGLTDRIEIPGVLPRDLAFAGANLLLLPSRVEAFGMVVTEALARGIPAIVSPGGPAEALGRTASGDLPGLVLPGLVLPESGFETLASLPLQPTTRVVEESEERASLETPLRDWLTNPQLRATLRGHALTRRGELAGWGASARLVLALTSTR